MPARTILLYPHALFKPIRQTVTELSHKISGLIRDLVDTMYAGQCSVLFATPQIGIALRVCVIDVSSNRNGKKNNHGLLVMVNPEITRRGVRRSCGRDA